MAEVTRYAEDPNQFFAEMCQEEEPPHRAVCNQDSCRYYIQNPYHDGSGCCIEDPADIIFVEKMEPWESWCCEW